MLAVRIPYPPPLLFACSWLACQNLLFRELDLLRHRDLQEQKPRVVDVDPVIHRSGLLRVADLRGAHPLRPSVRRIDFGKNPRDPEVAELEGEGASVTRSGRPGDQSWNLLG